MPVVVRLYEVRCRSLEAGADSRLELAGEVETDVREVVLSYLQHIV